MINHDTTWLHPVMVGYANKIDVPLDIPTFSKKYTRNLGNQLFVHALESIVQTSGAMPRLPQGDRFLGLDRSHALLTPMSNHISAHVDLASTHPHLPSTACQVLLIGLGMQCEVGEDPAPPQGTLDWLNKLQDSGGGIWTRGDDTSAFLRSQGIISSSPIGCPSLFISPDLSLGNTIASRIQQFLRDGVRRIGIAAGNPLGQNSKKLEVEKRLVGLIKEREGAYIVQHPIHLIAASIGWHSCVPNAVWARFQQTLFQDLSFNDIKHWFLKYSRFHVDVSQWLLSLKSFDLVVGARIHGVQAAIQSGVPAVCLTHDKRTKELCTKMCIPSLPIEQFLEGSGIDCVVDTLRDFDFLMFDENRRALASEAVGFLARYHVRPSAKLIALSTGVA